MNKLLTAVLLLATALTACQKEPSFEIPGSTPGGGGAAAGTKLVRMGSRVGTDSITSNFEYNTANLLSRLVQKGVVNGQAVDISLRIVRNSTNIITSTVITSNIFGGDSVTTYFAYDAALGRYKHAVSSNALFGVFVADSAVYNYDAAGRLTSTTGYTDDGTGGGYELGGKVEYAYVGNNLESQKSYSHNGTTFVLEESTDFNTYDTQVNPLQFPKDAPALSLSTFYSANNPTKQTYTDHTSTPPTVSSGTFTYTYNNKNRPLRVTTMDAGTVTSTTSYYYQ